MKMWSSELKWILVICVVLVVGCGAIGKRRKNDHADKILWKKQYEDELTESMLSTGKKEGNRTKVTQNVRSNDNEEVIEKLMETITSSEKYLRKVESIDFRLNRLDIEMHEKTNTIIKYLADMSKPLGSQNTEKLDGYMETLRGDITQLKYLMEKTPLHSEGEPVVNDHLDSRITYLENGMKHLIASVDGIVTTIAEVKNRQSNKPEINFKSSDTMGSSSVDVATLIHEFRSTLLEQRMKKCDQSLVGRTRSDHAEKYPSDCHEIQVQGFNVSGIYKIKPDDTEPFYALCDLTTVGGGWTVFQNRFDGTQDFFKTWSDYKNGFGNLATEFWLGLEKLHYLTNQKLYELRVELESQHGQEAYAGYSVFTVGPEYEGYRISTLGTYYGTAGDSLSYHAGQKFSTYDIDNDEWKDGSCANEHGGAWWYKECDKSNLNGKYVVQADEHSRGQSMYWISFKGPNFPLLKTKMMIRPLPASRPNYSSDGSRVKVQIIFNNTNIKKPLLRKTIDSPKLVRPLSDTSSAKSIKPKGTTYDMVNRYRYEDPFFSSSY